ncbi:MAG: roadblock/LC7 domain-containing protein [Actinobacteria bacterium]|jgi:predicted regulator of Ras-like GTPase activity (Roadblock/LC7/MglB family)|nr:roadblock/LC7 domain-containing protein [Actinomycetota bacterium]
MSAPTAPGDLGWLLANLTSTVDHVRQAVIFSADGLVMGTSPGLGREDSEHLSALAAGVQSLARGAGQRFRGGNVRQTIIEMDEALLFITAAGSSTCLAVLADSEADAGQVAYEMTVLVKRLGQHMGTSLRTTVPETGAG